VADFRDQDLRGAQFFRVRLDGARLEEVDLTGAWFHNVDLHRTTLRGAWLAGVEIDGLIEGPLMINGVDVAPLIEAEQLRQYPELAVLRPTDADGYRAAWRTLEELWAQTIAHVREFPPELLHERVDGEWSFIETLRHLVYATDAWVRRAYLGEQAPYSPLDLPHTETDPGLEVPRDLHARPSLEEVLALRADRMATVRRVLEELTDERLAGRTEPVPGRGYPPPDRYEVRRCLGAVLSEEWEHRRFALRDLAVLEARNTPGTTEPAGH
jgi:hypothetical protein